MRNSNSQRGTRPRGILSPTDSIIILPSNRLSFEQQFQQLQQQNANSNLDIFHNQPQRNIFGPVQPFNPQLRYLLKPPKKLDEDDATKGQKVKEAEDENANGRHVFLMDNFKNLKEHTQEITESEKADRALFTQKIMLAMLHSENENFQP